MHFFPLKNSCFIFSLNISLTNPQNISSAQPGKNYHKYLISEPELVRCFLPHGEEAC